ncbi:DUF6371 domain-containing protein [Mangrovimonas sp. DI 80]|uniref:DUF6371 domain-containing protein n=1 Tax=Mangrovimonas sp. DI 80 TaxID=1779330 RepID=UPI00097757E1|nr:DUF6371 domain-containing protein [Mangrovimonas sp. DI 80]OMP29691.1 hypothetical protein BKM32_16205 [Mangrovimonas sp. DI 80]
MNYRYYLDRSSKKFPCPNCHKKTFVRYMDAIENNYLEANLGRCDRESKCGYHNKPDGNQSIISPYAGTFIKPEPSFHNEDSLQIGGNNFNGNHFISYLKNFFDTEAIIAAIKKFSIGNSNHWAGATVFWQINERLQICAGKVMLYDPITGKRIKDPYPHINWMHKVLKIDDFVLQQCLFGIHNLCFHPKGSTACIVESEKTAIIMSIRYPQFLWLATGSKSNFKHELLKPLKGYQVIAFPDKTEFKNWSKKAEIMTKEGLSIRVNPFLERQGLEEGSDLVDYFTQAAAA